jgi:hypothetical protein
MGEGGRGVYGTAEREEEVVLGRRGEGGRKAGWGAWAERPNRPAGGWADWAKIGRKILFGIKIIFLNIPRLWKFVQGDLGGILIWGFFF